MKDQSSEFCGLIWWTSRWVLCLKGSLSETGWRFSGQVWHSGEHGRRKWKPRDAAPSPQPQPGGQRLLPQQQHHLLQQRRRHRQISQQPQLRGLTDGRAWNETGQSEPQRHKLWVAGCQAAGADEKVQCPCTEVRIWVFERIPVWMLFGWWAKNIFGFAGDPVWLVFEIISCRE